LHPRQVIIPGVLVDCVVVGEPETMRVKLGRELTRTVRPHIFESKAEAQAFHSKV
jgi:acyl CoA:acetate/3-ketoacid CoA transferase